MSKSLKDFLLVEEGSRVVSRRPIDPFEMTGIIDADQRVQTPAPLDDVHCTQALA